MPGGSFTEFTPRFAEGFGMAGGVIPRRSRGILSVPFLSLSPCFCYAFLMQEQPMGPAEQKDDAALRAAADRIGAMIQEMYALGANDAEIPESQRILARMEAGEIAPDDAISQVARFLERKQDYH